MRSLSRVFRSLVQERHAAAAAEFAICGLVMMAFIMAIINLGLLGFSVGTMQRGIQVAARNAAVTSANNYVNTLANGTNTYTCPSASTIAATFNSLTGNVLPPASTSSSSKLYLIAKWYNNSTGTAYTSMPPGVVVVVSVTYKWSPLDFVAFGNLLTLRLTTVSVVNGTDNTSASSSAPTIDNSCNINS